MASSTTSSLVILLAGCGEPVKAVPDAMVDAAPASLHDCRTFVRSSDNIVRFPGPAYSPSCLEITVGDTVRWTGNFEEHPLSPGRAPSRPEDPMGSPNNPIVYTDSGNLATVVFPSAGDYPYYCTSHDYLGMFGVVRVSPARR